MKKLFFITFAFAIFFAGCKKDEPVLTINEQINAMIPQQYRDSLTARGMPVYSGENPIDITGVYLVPGWSVYIKNKPLGAHSYEEVIRFSDKDKNYIHLESYFPKSSYYAKSDSMLLVGTGKQFTVYGKKQVTQSGNSYRAVQVYSGTLENGTIKNLYGSTVIIDNAYYSDNGKIVVYQSIGDAVSTTWDFK